MRTRLLVATDGTHGSLGALRMAVELDRRGKATVDVVSVLQPPPILPTAGFASVGVTYPLPDAASVGRVRDSIARQLASLGPQTGAWPVRVEVGAPAVAIARCAREVDASLVLVGLRPHGALERVFRAETALELIHLADFPVLAVPASTTGLPRRILVAVDFGEASHQAAQAVLAAIADPARIDLAHVVGGVLPEEAAELQEWQRTYVAGARSRLEEMAAELWSETSAHLEVHVATGDVETAILQLAHQLGSDLIATGSHGYGRLGRAFMRSLSTAVVRAARCPVLVMPPAPSGRSGGVDEMARAAASTTSWP